MFSFLLSPVASCDFTELCICVSARRLGLGGVLRCSHCEECGPIESFCLCLYVCLWPLIVSSCTAEFQPQIFANIATAHSGTFAQTVAKGCLFIVAHDTANRTLDYV